ncbi:hypothetical protein Tco_0341020, partial [Tanacetum coccineum]
TAYKSKRSQLPRHRISTQVCVSYDLTKPVTPHSWPQVRKSYFAKSYNVNAPGPSRNSPKHVSFQSTKEFVGSNDMVHNYYLEEAKKKSQLQKNKALNTKPSIQQSTRLPNTTNSNKPKPRNFNQQPRNWPLSMSSHVSNRTVNTTEPPRNQKTFLKSKDLACPTCKKCIYSANHDECILKYLLKLNSRASTQKKDAQSHKTTKRYIPIEKKRNSENQGRQIPIGQRFSPNKSSNVFLIIASSPLWFLKTKGSKMEYKFQDQENSEDIFSFGSTLEDFICIVFILDRNIVSIYLYSDAWSLYRLEITLEQIPPYNSTLPSLEDIRNGIYKRVVFEKQTKDGIMKKHINQIEINELFDYLKPCEIVLRENAYVAIRNRDHVQASLALMLYCLETGRPYNLVYFIVMRMNYFRDRSDKVLPYGMILTHLFKNLKETKEEHPFDE